MEPTYESETTEENTLTEENLFDESELESSEEVESSVEYDEEDSVSVSENEIETESGMESVPGNESESSVEESYSTYFGYRVYYNLSGYPYYFDENGKRQYISDVENILGPGEEFPEESTEDVFDDVVISGSDTEALILSINQQTEVIQKGDAAICAGLGILIGILLIQGFRLRRI